MFYKLPPDLEDVKTLVMMVSQEMGSRGNGYGTPGLLEEYLPQAAKQLRATRDRLLTSGRAKDLKAFRKHLLSIGGYLDNGVYNQAFYPLVAKNLAD